MAHDGTKFGEVSGLNRQFQLQLNQPETVTYSLSLNSQLANQAYTEPDITDFLVYYKGRELCAGMHTEVNINDVDNNLLDVSGRGWLHYLETRIWPPINRDGTDHFDYSATDKDMIAVAQELVGYVTVWDTPKPFDVFFSGAYSGQLIDYDITAGSDSPDTEAILSKVQALAQSHPGFDFELTWNHWFNTYYPQKGRVRSYVFEQGLNCGPIQFKNPGNGGNFFWGTGLVEGGASSSAWSWNDADVLSRRRKDITTDFGDTKFQANLDFLTQGGAARQVMPIKQISMEWRGDERIANILDEVSLGDTVLVKGKTYYEDIYEWFRIVGMDFQPTDNDDERVTFTFDDGTLSL